MKIYFKSSLVVFGRSPVDSGLRLEGLQLFLCCYIVVSFELGVFPLGVLLCYYVFWWYPPLLLFRPEPCFQLLIQLSEHFISVFLQRRAFYSLSRFVLCIWCVFVGLVCCKLLFVRISQTFLNWITFLYSVFFLSRSFLLSSLLIFFHTLFWILLFGSLYSFLLFHIGWLFFKTIPFLSLLTCFSEVAERFSLHWYNIFLFRRFLSKIRRLVRIILFFFSRLLSLGSWIVNINSLFFLFDLWQFDTRLFLLFFLLFWVVLSLSISHSFRKFFCLPILIHDLVDFRYLLHK